MDETKTKAGPGSRVGRLLLAGALTATAAAPVPAAADDVFLKLEGVQGESTDARHKGEIDILSYTQTFTGPFARSASGTGAGAGKTICGPVTLKKFVDVSSPDLILNVAIGLHIPTAVITFRRPGGANQPEYYRVTLEDVIVTEIEQTESKIDASNPAAARTIEKVSLIGRRLRFDYVQQTPDGRRGGTPKAGWDCVANRKM
jgi:type VI secretion system secreted protein Hcp